MNGASTSFVYDLDVDGERLDGKLPDLRAELPGEKGEVVETRGHCWSALSRRFGRDLVRRCRHRPVSDAINHAA